MWPFKNKNKQIAITPRVDLSRVYTEKRDADGVVLICNIDFPDEKCNRVSWELDIERYFENNSKLKADANTVFESNRKYCNIEIRVSKNDKISQIIDVLKSAIVFADCSHEAAMDVFKVKQKELHELQKQEGNKS